MQFTYGRKTRRKLKYRQERCRLKPANLKCGKNKILIGEKEGAAELEYYCIESTHTFLK